MQLEWFWRGSRWFLWSTSHIGPPVQAIQNTWKNWKLQRSVGLVSLATQEPCDVVLHAKGLLQKRTSTNRQVVKWKQDLLGLFIQPRHQDQGSVISFYIPRSTQTNYPYKQISHLPFEVVYKQSTPRLLLYPKGKLHSLEVVRLQMGHHLQPIETLHLQKASLFDRCLLKSAF